MKCPFCSYRDSRVVDSRAVEEGGSIRRRRECPDCGRRFTTYEKYEETPLIVSKKDGRRELFDPKKLMQGLLKAFEKRPVSYEKIQEVATNIEREVRMSGESEVSSVQIGEIVMKYLEQTDQIAYVRFASVYRQFADVKNFMQELERIMKTEKK
ncbi:MAG: transcriptional regulator NrdR [Phascolarctobacterium sp.]|nr:transcriptional regulator NrdR [Phascolarctobacterium sp.]